MIVFLYSNIACEHQAINCIKSLSHIIDDIKVVYYTIGFDSSFEFKNLHKVRYPLKPEYPRFHFYKAELSLLTMAMFPQELYFFIDTDVLFTHRFTPERIYHQNEYPLASFGPHEYPFVWERQGEVDVIFNESRLMEYFNVPARTQRYVWSCAYSYTEKSKDFFEEYTSICRNQYLQSSAKYYFPFADETAFNVCLWKRNATENLGFAFVNTFNLTTVKLVEETDRTEFNIGNAVDHFGSDWEYVHNPKDVLWYHGFKHQSDMEPSLNYLLEIRNR